MKKFIYLFPIFLLAALLAAGGAGCSAKAKRDYHLKKADQFYDAGQFDQAEAEYMNALRNDHENFQAISRLGVIYFDEGRLKKAAPFIFKGCELATNDLDLHLKLGLIYFTAGKVDDARDEANFVLARKPQDEQAPLLLAETAMTPKAIAETKSRLQLLSQKGDSPGLEVALGTFSLRAGDLKMAEAAFKRAQALNPKSSAPWSALGSLYLAQTNLAQAESALKTAADLAPARSQEKVQYAEFKAQSGDLAAGKSLLEDMVKNTPDYIPAWMALVKIAAAEKKYDDCASLLDKVLARDPDNYEAMLSSAQVQLAQGKTADATAALERMTTIYPQAPGVQYQLAGAYLAGNENEKAADSLGKVVALDPNFADAALLLAELQIKKGDVNPAIISLKQFIQQHPQIPQARLLLADAYRAQGNFADAIGIYRELEAANPKNFEVPLLLGTALIEQKNNGAARTELTRALALAPDNFTVVEQLVDLDLLEKQYAAALQLVQPQLDKNPKLAAPRILQAQIFMSQGDAKSAEAGFLKAVELQPEIEMSHMLLARLYMDSKQNEKALAELQIAAEKNPKDMTPLLFTGMIHNDEKDYKGARDVYEKLLALDPKFSPALNNLAYIYSEYLDDLTRAYELAQRARELLPNDPSTADTLGWILCKKGQYLSAAALLQLAADQLPDEPEVQFHLGKARYFLGDEDAARLALQRALQPGRDFRGKDECNQCLAVLAVDVKTAGADVRASLEKRVAAQPDDSIALVRLAGIYQRDGAADKAVGAYESALKANPKNLAVLINLTRLYSANKNTQKALELAKAAYQLAPDNTEVSHALGRLAYETGDYKLSVNLLQEVARKESGNPQVLFDFAEAAYATGQVPDAEAAMHSALQAGNAFSGAGEAARFLNLIALAANPSQAVTAASQVAEILKTEPNYVPALMVSGLVSEQKNDAATAKQTYQKVLGQYADFSPAQKRLAILCAENAGNDPQAGEFAAKARAAFPDDPEVAKAFGIILYRQADYSRAEQLLKESAGKSTSDSEIFYYLGMAQYHLKETADCKKNLQLALTLNLSAKFTQETKQVLTELK
jgi:tetratricopeptide (TPR) repeat protein